MKLMINHQTHYHYSEPASRSIQYIRMSPQSNQHQYVHSWDVSIPGVNASSKDAFDNVWMTSTQVENYQQLLIMAQGVVEIAAGKTIHIATSGGASVTIEGGNITFNCPGTITVHASKKSFVGPSSYKHELPKWNFEDMKKKRLVGFSG